MAVIEGGVSGALQGVGAENMSCAHVVRGHVAIGSGGAYRIGAQSGTMSASLTNGSEIFQFRYTTVASNIALIYRVQISAAINAAASAAALAGFAIVVARGWTADGSGGTLQTLTGNNCKLRTSLNTCEAVIRIASTGALTAGTKTNDSSFLSHAAFSFLTGAITVATDGNVQPMIDLFNADSEGGYPIVLANQEGITIQNRGATFPAGATWHFGVNVSWLEVPNF